MMHRRPYIIIGSGNNHDWIVFADDGEEARDMALDDYSRSQIAGVHLARPEDVRRVLAEEKPWNADELTDWLAQQERTA
jgi:hypothetical protein